MARVTLQLALLCIAVLWSTQLKAEESAFSITEKLQYEKLQLQLPKKDQRWGPLRRHEQILITLKRDFNAETQLEVLERVTAAGGIFVHYIPEWSFLFLGGDGVITAAREMHDIVSVKVYDASYKISPEWKPVLKALEFHSLETLAETPLHQLPIDSKILPEDNNLFGNLAVDKTGSDYRLVIEVGFPQLHKTEVHSESLEESDYAPAQAAAEDWLIPLQEHFGQEIDVIAYHGLLDVFVPEPIVHSVLEVLSQQSCVHWLQPKTKMQLHNWRASSIIQSGLAPGSESRIIDAETHPIWSAGIQGEGQIVGCGDSGVDIESCFFYDPDVPFTGFQSSVYGSVHSFFRSEDHRKIRYYGSSSDLFRSDVHGTHVVGTLVGNPFKNDDEMAVANKGMAPAARLAFMDLGGRSAGSEDSIFTPRELSKYYYPITYEQGARIHSDSWGSDSPAYDHLAQEVDKFVWENQDFLPVFAAGNYGQLSLMFLNTVTSPAVAKNCISVGATLTANEDSSFMNNNIEAYLIEVRIAAPDGNDEVREYKILAADFGASWSELIGERDIELTTGTPVNGCTTLDPAIRQTIVLLERGGCSFVQKLINAQSRDAVGVIVMNDVNNGYFEMQSTEETADSELTIPMASVPASIGRQLLELLESKRQVTIHVMDRTEPEHAFDNIADFSSSGPTTDFRIKPDIVAPGQIKSVWNDGENLAGPGQCALRTASGTSMATPVVAGAAVLVRQYFVDGYYPTGARTPKNSHLPSGALIKATLLGGAFPMDGYTEAGLPLDPPPSPRQGFGRVLLETSIPVEGSSKWEEGWKIQVVDGANLTAGASHEYCVRALGGPIRVTLVWTDPPASPSSSVSLVNDLDLSVRSAGLKGRELLGNGVEDHANNVERVLMDDMPEGNLAIVVNAHRIVSSYGPQPYALVVQGRFNGILQSIHNPYQSETHASSDLCIITLAVLQSGPDGPVNDNSPEFTFTTQSGVLPVNGFECKLTDPEGNRDGEALHDWRECESPLKYENLPDKEYIFTLRPKNEDVEVHREFIVDTEAPQTVIQGQPIPEASAQEFVEFDFGAEDLTAVTYRCRLEFEGRQRGVQIARLNSKEADMDLDTWFPCSSPEIFRGLTYGNWTFKVRGKDEAGNEQAVPTEWSWRIAFTPQLNYVRTLESPLGVSASHTVLFRLQVVTGGESGQAVRLNNEPVECRLFPISNPLETTYPFRDCPLSLQFPNISDGTYGFEARTVDSRGHEGVSVSFVEFSVDSTDPTIFFSQRPESFHAASDLVLKFAANEVVTGFNCSMRRRGAPKRFNQCPGTEAGTVDYQLEDGEYTFQVEARDVAGNIGQSENVTFIIDSKPPRILFKSSAQFATNQNNVSFEFEVRDGGSGIDPENMTCLLSDESSGVRAEPQSNRCVSPMNFNLEEGRYVFTLRAADRAGLVNEKDLPIIVDLTAPSISWATKPSAMEMQPSFVLFQFEGSDTPKNIASLVTGFECKLVRTRQTQTIQTQSIELSEGGKRRMLVHTEASGITARHLLQSNETAGVTDEYVIRIRDGAVVVLGEWIECEDPVILTGMPSGNYEFQVRAIDLAGNVGEPTSVSIFSVDETLPIPGEETEPSSENSIDVSPAIGLGLAAASVVFVLCMCVVVGCWRRRSRRRRIEKLNARRSGVGQSRRENISTTSSTDPMLAAALQASLREQRADEDRRRRKELTSESQRISLAMEQSMEQMQYQKALERSLYES